MEELFWAVKNTERMGWQIRQMMKKGIDYERNILKNNIDSRWYNEYGGNDIIYSEWNTGDYRRI